jgi:cytochrome c biogenesis protein CcmG/thiol:disulfide interchange protein DsbE
MRRLTLIAGGVLALLAFSAALYLFFGGSGRGGEGTPVDVAAVAPDFILPDAGGMSVTLSKVKGTVKVVNFWASWSPYSREELPALARLKQSYGDTVTAIALDRDTDPADGRQFLASLGLGNDLLFVYDQGDTYFTQVGGYNMPETLILDADGRILEHVHGPMTEDALHAAIDRALHP